MALICVENAEARPDTVNADVSPLVEELLIGLAESDDDAFDFADWERRAKSASRGPGESGRLLWQLLVCAYSLDVLAKNRRLSDRVIDCINALAPYLELKDAEQHAPNRSIAARDVTFAADGTFGRIDWEGLK